MTSAMLVLVLILAPTALGTGHHAPRPGACEGCGVENAAVVEQIVRLQSCPNWHDRERAAHALRRFDWHCHPDAVGALALALLKDGHEEVREEAAQSLTRLAPCLPVAHQALSRAANLDPDHATRHWARKGLNRLARRCDAPCHLCGTSASPPTGDAPIVVGPPLVPPLGSVPSPPIESRVAPEFSPPPPPPASDLPEAIPSRPPFQPEPRLEGPTSSLKGRPIDKPTFLGSRLRSRKR